MAPSFTEWWERTHSISCCRFSGVFLGAAERSHGAWSPRREQRCLACAQPAPATAPSRGWRPLPFPTCQVPLTRNYRWHPDLSPRPARGPDAAGTERGVWPLQSPGAVGAAANSGRGCAGGRGSAATRGAPPRGSAAVSGCRASAAQGRSGHPAAKLCNGHLRIERN